MKAQWFVMPDCKVKVDCIDYFRINAGIASEYSDYKPMVALILARGGTLNWYGAEGLYAIDALKLCGFYTLVEHTAARLRMTRYLDEYSKAVKKAEERKADKLIKQEQGRRVMSSLDKAMRSSGSDSRTVFLCPDGRFADPATRIKP